jgi:hypothetical protein
VNTLFLAGRTTTFSPITVSGLTPNTPYTFTVTATNSGGTSVASSASTSVTTIPSPPTSLISSVVSSTSVSVAFTPPSGGNGTITSYTVISSPGGLTGTGASSPIVVSGLSVNTTYTFSATATNASGTSTSSSASASVTISNSLIFPPSAFTTTGTTSTGYRVYTFTSTSTTYTIPYTCNTASSMHVLCVGGGGSGGFDNAGGGGGGGVVLATIPIPVGSDTLTLNVGAGKTCSPTVDGGVGVTSTAAFTTNMGLNIRAGGGGSGVNYNGATKRTDGSADGGSGSGTNMNSSLAGGLGITSFNNFANNGGAGVFANTNNSGGGGAGAVGATGNVVDASGCYGSGGDGILCTLNGIKDFGAYGSYYWGGGGGGAAFTRKGGKGGKGGGGGGNFYSVQGSTKGFGDTNGLNPGFDGTDNNVSNATGNGGNGGINTGGGGGGSSITGSSGGLGGSGIIVVAIVNVVHIDNYTFRVKSTTSVVPTTVDGYTLTNAGGVTMVNDATRGYVFNLAGNNSLSINLATPVNSTKTFWVSTSTTGGSSNVFSTTKMPIWFDNTTFLRASVNFNTTGVNVISNVAQTSTWMFYAITTTATTTSLYVDGTLVSSVNVAWTGDTATMFFGAYQGGNYLTGLLDDIRFYSNILTSTDIQTLYINTSYTFRVKSTTSVVPTTVDGYTLSNTNVTMVNDATRGFVFSFGTNKSLSINLATPINSTKTFWLSSSSPQNGDGNVFSTTKMPIYFNSTTFLKATVNFGSSPVNVISTIAQTSTWRFYAITTTATTTTMYVNGTVVASASVAWTGDTSAMYFGSFTSGANNYTGSMDDIRFYSKILTPTEIQTLYTSTLL